MAMIINMLLPICFNCITEKINTMAMLLVSILCQCRFQWRTENKLNNSQHIYETKNINNALLKVYGMGLYL